MGGHAGRFLKLLPLFIMVLPGAFALQLYPNLPSPDQVFPTLVTDLLPVVAIFLLGVFWPRTNGNGAFATLAGGHVLSLTVFVLSRMGVIDLHLTIIAGILTAICIGILVVTSLTLGDAPDPEKVEDLTWANRVFETGPAMVWYKNYRVHAATVLGLTAVMIVVFW